MSNPYLATKMQASGRYNDCALSDETVGCGDGHSQKSLEQHGAVGKDTGESVTSGESMTSKSFSAGASHSGIWSVRLPSAPRKLRSLIMLTRRPGHDSAFDWDNIVSRPDVEVSQ
jgi:hypothetical protein